MNVGNNITILRKQYKSALENFEFDKAEMIDKQIQHLRNQISRAQTPHQSETFRHEIDAQKEKYHNISANKYNQIMQEREQIQKNFHNKYLSLQSSHSHQITDLASQHEILLEKEMQRPVPEAENLFNHSKVLGKAKKYSDAKATYNEAQNIKKKTLEERRRSCSINYEKQLRALKNQQAREIQLLSDKQNAALQILDQQNEEAQNLISTQLKFKEYKTFLKKSKT